MREYATSKGGTSSPENSRKIQRLIMDDIAEGRMSYDRLTFKTRKTDELEKMLLNCNFKRELSFRTLGHVFPNLAPESIRKMVDKYKGAGLVRTYLSADNELMIQSTGR